MLASGNQHINKKLKRMSSLWTTNCLVFVICIFVFSKSRSKAEKKEPEYCNDLCSAVEVLCKPTNCTNKQVEGYKPELCRCCKECYTRLGNPACAGIQCNPPQCGRGARPIVKAGACCPTCEGFGNPLCEGIQCGAPNCLRGSTLKLKDNACCPTCEPFGNPRCAGIQCGIPLCPAGTVLRLKDEDCCASCQPAR